jgi:surface adhesion protein
VAENVKPTFTVHINQPLDHDLVVTLSNNAQVTIKAGETSAPYTHAAQGDDVYNDAGQISLGIKSAVDATVHLREPAAGRRGFGSSHRHHRRSGGQADRDPFGHRRRRDHLHHHADQQRRPADQQPLALTFTLSDGTVITVPANGTTGSAVTAPDNVYVGTNDPVVNRSTGQRRRCRQVRATDPGQDPVSTTVTDEPGTPGNEGDLVKVTITADQTSVAENVKPTFTVHINQPLDHDLVVTLSNNAQVTIKAGETSAPYEHAAQGDDVYNDAGEISLGIKSAVDARSHLREPAAGRCGFGQSHRHHRRSGGQADRDPFGHRRRRDHLHHHADQQRRSADQQPLGADLHAERRQNRHHRAGQRHHRFATVTAPDNVYVGTNDPVVKSIDR